MPVCNVILRLDYSACFKFMNEQGSAMQLMLEYNKHYFQGITDNNMNRNMAAMFKSPDGKQYHSLSIQPTAFAAQIQSADEIELDKLQGHALFKCMVDFATLFCETFAIKTLTRVGLRIIYLGPSGKEPSSERVLKTFSHRVDNKYKDAVCGVLGDLNDIGIVFTGVGDDKLQYRINAGPYFAEKEAHIHADQVADELKKIKDYDFMCDIDQFESAIATPVAGFHKWSRAAIEKSGKAIEAVRDAASK